MVSLLRQAEPLLRERRANGWTEEESFHVLCERWLSDMQVEYTMPRIMADRSRHQIKKRIEAMVKVDAAVVRACVGKSPAERSKIKEELQFIAECIRNSHLVQVWFNVNEVLHLQCRHVLRNLSKCHVQIKSHEYMSRHIKSDDSRSCSYQVR